MIKPSDCKRVLESLSQLVLIISRDGTILYCNNTVESMFGYSNKEAVGKKFWSIFPSISKNDVDTQIDQLRNKESVNATLEGRHKTDSALWIDLDLQNFRAGNGEEVILATGSDVTDAVETKREFEREEQNLQAILDTAVEGIITIDIRGIIESFNKAAEDIFGYSAEEVVGRNVKVLMPDPYYKEHDQYMENYLKTGEKKIIGIGREVRGKRKNGEVFPMELSVSEVKINGDRIFTGIIRDISERRMLENEILQITERERQRIGRELHDGLGQMLTGIGLIAKNLANKLSSNELPGAEEVSEIADMIREADEQARSLSHGLVNLDLEEGIHAAFSQLCSRASRLFNIECQKDIDPDLEITNKVAKLNLYRIVQEAVSNAVKHGEASRVEVKLQQNSDFLRLQVIDNGVGFTPSTNKSNDTGMGVNIMKYRANMLGGYLNFQETAEGHTMLDCKIPQQEFENLNLK